MASSTLRCCHPRGDPLCSQKSVTAMGRDLATLMTVLQQWGDRWIYGEGHEPLPIGIQPVSSRR
jgi:DNA-binding HxlR family transcriptional regulator